MLKRALLFAILLISHADYVWRGHRLITEAGLSDFQDPYVGARLWLTGQNPYSQAAVRDTWSAATGLPVFNQVKTVYPTTTYLLVAPLGLFRYSTALVLWLMLQLLSVYAIAGIIWMQRWFSESLIATMALVTAYSPFHTALHGANCGPLCMALALASCVVRNQKVCGVLLALAICIKPQIAVWFLLYFIVKQRWSGILTCIASGILISAVSLAPYLTKLPQVANGYRDQYSRGFRNGSSGDYTRNKSDRLSMVNLQPAIYQFTKSRTAANVLAFSVFFILGGWWFVSSRHSENDLLIIGALVALSILPIYRRTNDLGLFVLPLIWAIKNYPRWAAILTGTCAGLFFIPINSILARLSIYGLLSGVQSWIVLLIPCAMILAMWGAQRSTERRGNYRTLPVSKQAATQS